MGKIGKWPTQEHDDDVVLCVLPDFAQPSANVVETRLVRDVIQEQERWKKLTVFIIIILAPVITLN